MPHSGGGGSHGGGFHGGGSRGGTGSGHHISHTYFRGAKRYRYLKSDGQYEYVYMNSIPSKSDRTSLVTMFGFFIAIILFITIGMAVSIVNPPKKLKGSYDSPGSHILGYSYLDHTEELEESLVEFEETTGICPIVYCTYNVEWITEQSLEDYAYDLYLEKFDDEEHFMIVYSTDPYNPDKWHWESMVGDDTDDILTNSKLKKLGEDLQEDLESGTEPGEALTKYFDEASDYVMLPVSEAKSNAFLPVGFMVFIMLLFVVILIMSLKQYSRKYERVDKKGNPIDDDLVEEENQSKPAMSPEDMKKVNAVNSISSLIVCIFTIPFIAIGVRILVQAITAFKEGSANASFLLLFALLWNGIIITILITTISKMAKKRKETVSPDADVRKAEALAQEARKKEPVPVEYPEPEAMDKPAEEKMNAFEKAQVYDENLIDAALNRESHVDYDDEDYKRMKRDGFE
jgi:hypothetical protein